MPDLLLWRRLTENDVNAITGQAAPSGTGGGAKHIPLGIDRPRLPIQKFLGGGSAPITIPTEPKSPVVPASTLVFGVNPSRNNEWRIANQHLHRHPAWSTAAGFPTAYSPIDRPIVFVARQGSKYHVGFSTEKALRKTAPSLAKLIDGSKSRNTGILKIDPTWSSALDLGSGSSLAAYEALVETPEAEKISEFDPKDLADGRKKQLAEIIRRQGQPSFRKKLLKAYNAVCAITGTSLPVVLEAAHITPYLGPATNATSNGILLRGDLHTLFDLGLVTVDKDSMEVKVSNSTKEHWILGL